MSRMRFWHVRWQMEHWLCVYKRDCISQCFNTAEIQINSQARSESHSITWIFPPKQRANSRHWLDMRSNDLLLLSGMSILVTKQESLVLDITQILLKNCVRKQIKLWCCRRWQVIFLLVYVIECQHPYDSFLREEYFSKYASNHFWRGDFELFLCLKSNTLLHRCKT